MKRLFDIICSALGLILLSPLFLWVAWRIRKEDEGPVFYRGERTGFHGVPFRIYKFRSMVMNADKIGGPSTSGEDPRITKIGRIIRAYKLDEFAQLINVFLGDMSLVGPRPEIKRYTDQYTEEEKAILTIRPGITDWASIWNSDEGAVLDMFDDPDKGYEEYLRPKKLQLQLKYVRKRKFPVDLVILFKTAMSVFSRAEAPALTELKALRASGKQEEG
jgi:lipopolysaccharide/colanic/teichoic acid biosynthesis glycosyltransferase